MKEISIIIATYDAGKVLQRCLDSIRPQKTEEIELLFIDGGSKDNTMDIVNSNKDIVDYVVSELDKGIYDAWNKGIKIANGRWIMFVGADDVLLPDILPDYVAYSKTIDDSYDLITAKAEFVDLSGKLIKVIGEPFRWERYKRNMNISHGSTLHNRKMFEEVGLYSLYYKICADYEMFMRKGKDIRPAYYNHVILRFTIGGASFSAACQKETFEIRRQYHTVSTLVNCLLYMKRCIGIICKKYLYRCE